MNAILIGLCVALMLSGAMGIVWWICNPQPAARSAAPVRRRTRTLSKKTLTKLGIGFALGIVSALITSLPLMILVGPVAAIVLPSLFSKGPIPAQIARAEALSEWTRSLAAGLQTGSGLEQAIRTTLNSTAAPIRAAVADLAGRLESRVPTERALRLFADDLDNPIGDAIAANLILAAKRRGPGLAGTLDHLASATARDVSVMREIAADREKPRSTMRWMIVITVIAWTLFFFSDYAAYYRDGLGQVLLALYLSIFGLGIYLWHRLSIIKAPIRYIGTAIEGTPA